MRKRILLPLAALLTTVLAAVPAQASEAEVDTGQRPGRSSVEMLQHDAAITATGYLGPDTSRAAPPPPPPRDCDGWPCWPNCLYQVFPCWEIREVNYFTNNATDGMNTLCMGGRLQLSEGYYDWGYIWSLPSKRATGYKLAGYQSKLVGAGWYGMSVCMDPRSGHQYTWTMGLWPDNPAWQPWVHSMTMYISDPNWYEWGAYLDPLF